MDARRRRLLDGAKLAMGILVCYLLFSRGLIDPGRIRRALALHPAFALAAVSTHGLVYAAMGFRWRVVAKSCQVFLGRLESVRLTLVSLAISTALPGNGAGDLVKAWIAAKRSTYSQVMASIVLDRWTGITGLFQSWAIWCSIMAIQTGDGGTIARGILPLAWIAALAATTLCFAAGPLADMVPRPRLATGWVARILHFLHGILSSAARSSRDRRTVAGALLISVCAQQAMVAIGWCCARTVGVDLSITEVGAILPATMLANALPLSPGGLGLGEGLGAVLFTRLGHPGWTGSETLLLVRLASVTWAVPGVVAWLSYRAKPPA